MFFYDPNYIEIKNHYNFKNGVNSMFRRCYYGKDTNYYVL